MFLLPGAFAGHCGNIPKPELHPFADYQSVETKQHTHITPRTYLDSLSPDVTEYLEKNQGREEEVSMDFWLEGADHCVRDITATDHSASLVGKQRGMNTQPTLSFSAGPRSMDGAAHL